jgi:hypothetical protein
MSAPWQKPRKLLPENEPAEAPTFCGKETAHRAHIWDEAEEPIVLRADETYTAKLPFVRHWCKGFGHLEGYL